MDINSPGGIKNAGRDNGVNKVFSDPARFGGWVLALPCPPYEIMDDYVVLSTGIQGSTLTRYILPDRVIIYRRKLE